MDDLYDNLQMRAVLICLGESKNDIRITIF